MALHLKVALLGESGLKRTPSDCKELKKPPLATSKARSPLVVFLSYWARVA